jgi:hypothetical protein
MGARYWDRNLGSVTVIIVQAKFKSNDILDLDSNTADLRMTIQSNDMVRNTPYTMLSTFMRETTCMPALRSFYLSCRRGRTCVTRDDLFERAVTAMFKSIFLAIDLVQHIPLKPNRYIQARDIELKVLVRQRPVCRL